MLKKREKNYLTFSTNDNGGSEIRAGLFLPNRPDFTKERTHFVPFKLLCLDDNLFWVYIGQVCKWMYSVSVPKRLESVLASM